MTTRRGQVVLVALLLLGVGGVLSTATACSDPAPLSAQAATPQVDAEADADPDGEQPPSASPTSTGPPTEWVDDVERYEYLGGVQLPGSPTAGPVERDGGLASGFARSPMGAVMAGANILARLQGSFGAPVWVPTIQEQVVGPHQVYLLRIAQSGSRPETPAPGEVILGSDIRFVGWQWESYTDDAAMVRHLVAVTPAEPDGPPYLALEVETRWVDGDWRLVAPDYGDFSDGSEQLPDDSGFEIYRAA